MTAFLPGDIVRHQSGIISTLEFASGDHWWNCDEHGAAHFWPERQFTLVERPYPGTFDHVMSDVSINERRAPAWVGRVFLLVAAVVLGLVAWFGIYLVGLL